ncbi:DUF4157 domain-containing protein [Ornithinimicrobium sp. F0845]|uniref:eCIS core domain-containing protein n=1 Tax=Ornithinimicrobium sp. F0845 TaxID=2926412 RepID=UPI001FF5BBEB|nr:DUF4157 domain-containing protein [Ornithinimicrobium sp. F0845]MCK0113070.1 DUF4157 domain-containing protein [Ornithinimicrobium sp. F0845]
MRDHSQESDATSLRPKSARIDEEPMGSAARAAGEGRTEVLSASDVLGLQRLAGNAGVSAAVEEERSPVHDVIGSPGRPLDDPVRADMEARLGHDFSDVRVHDDGAAHASAASVNAHAYTVGSHVVFQRDAYDPSSSAGQQTLAHELTHVVQQRSGPVDGTSAGGGIAVSDPGDRFEREAAATAERAMAGPAPAHDHGVGTVQRSTGEPALGIQRQEGEEEEEPVQAMAVQREEAPEEEAEEPTG